MGRKRTVELHPYPNPSSVIVCPSSCKNKKRLGMFLRQIGFLFYGFFFVPLLTRVAYILLYRHPGWAYVCSQGLSFSSWMSGAAVHRRTSLLLCFQADINQLRHPAPTHFLNRQKCCTPISIGNNSLMAKMLNLLPDRL